MSIPRNVYIAGFFDTRERLYPHRDRLVQLGFTSVSRWLDEPKAAIYATSTEAYLLACAVRDLEDIKKADMFILDTLDVSPRGGAQVEWGVALTRMACERIVIGPFRNVFHRLAHAHYTNWGDFFNALTRRAQ